MPTVNELAAPYENFMLSPRQGPGVCVRCFNFTEGYGLCYACSRRPAVLAVVAPISYSVGGEQLHHALASYKRLRGDVARRLTASIAAVLWRYLVLHERCIARAAGVPSFPVVTTVPSSEARRLVHPMGEIVGHLVAPTRQRYQELLARSDSELAPREFNPDKFAFTQTSGWRAGASDRRHVDYGCQRAERGGRAAVGRSRPGGRCRDRSPREPQLA